MRSRIVFAAVALAAVAAAAVYVAWRKMPPRPAELWAQVDRYCVECHNRDDLTAGIAFDAMRPASVAQKPQIFEAAVRKLRGHLMPPPGRAQPDAATRRALVDWLESTLDATAAAGPATRPGELEGVTRSPKNK